MVQSITTTEIRIPRSKGKVDGKVLSKRRYVFHFINALMQNVLFPTPKNEIHALSERIADLVIRKSKPLDTVRVTVSPKYCGYTKIAGKTIGVYDFVLTIHVKDKVISVYEIRRNFDDRLFDIRFRAPRINDGFSEFLPIANYVSVINDYDFWEESFTSIVNYVVNNVRVKTRVNAYDISANVTEFLTFINEYTDVFYDKELRELVGKRYVYYWYRYLRNSGYFFLKYGDIE
jgi:hypothetical protein